MMTLAEAVELTKAWNLIFEAERSIAWADDAANETAREEALVEARATLMEAKRVLRNLYDMSALECQ